MKVLAVATISVVFGKNTKQTSDSTSQANAEYDGPPVQIEFRGLDGWGFGNFMNPFASLISDEPEESTGDEDEYDYPINEYGVSEYDYYDDLSDEYEGVLEGFNITMFEGSEAVRRVQAAVQMHESFDFRGGGFGTINEGPNSPGVQAASAKRIQVLMKMIMYLQADPSFDKFFQYGCWCFPDGEMNVLGGYGEAQDGADSV